jgi:type II secretory pathway component PulC
MHEQDINKPWLPVLPLLTAGLLLAASPLASAADGAETEARVEYKTMLEEAERARREAQSARAEATRAAEMAREAALAERQDKRLQEEELARVREELSRAHRELREATREVARAHRDLARNEARVNVEYINLGDRPVIGVLLGESTEDGIRLAGVSPDGPAERAGLVQGDILASVAGHDLTERSPATRDVLTRSIAEAREGEELAVQVVRDGQLIDFFVKPERREPGSWQSVISIPSPPDVPGVPPVPGAPSAPSAHHSITVERIVVPEIDVEALNEQVQEITRRVQENSFVFVGPDGEKQEFHFSGEGGFDFDFPHENVFGFALPHMTGLELASINEGLGAYFKTDRGVLVLKAREDNAWGLEAGDVLLQIGEREVNTPSDVMRALREMNPGVEAEFKIKRDRRDKTLTVAVPERQLGFMLHDRG